MSAHRWPRSIRGGTTVLATLALSAAAACGSSSSGGPGSISTKAVTPVVGCGPDAISDLKIRTDYKVAHCDPGAPGPKPLPAKTNVTIAMTTSIGDPFLRETLGIEMGEFAKENLNVKIVILPAADAIQSLAQGKIDAYHGGISAGVINAIASKFDIRAVMGEDTPGPDSNDGVWARGKSTTVKDLVGKTLAARAGTGSPPIAYVLASKLKDAGVRLDQIHQAQLSPVDSIAALKRGAVDAAYLSAPVPTEIVNGDYALLSGTTPVGEALSALMFGPAILNGHQDVGQAIVRAEIRVQNTYLNNLKYKKGKYGAQILKAMQEPPSFADTPAIVLNYEIMNGTIDRLTAAFKAAGSVTKDVKVTDADFIDRSYIEQAVGRKYGNS